MSNIKVIDINEEAKQEAIEEPVEIEEATEQIEPTNEVVEDTTTEAVVEEPKEEIKETKTDAKQVQCPKCLKYMSNKNFRYRHEKLCTTEPKPVKPQAKPKGKSKPKAQPTVKDVEVVEEEIIQPKPKLTQPVSNQIFKPQTPNLVDFASHYQLLQNQFIQQKKEKYNNLCQSMFSTKFKKR